MPFAMHGRWALALSAGLLSAACLTPARAADITLTSDAARALDEIYTGDSDAAIMTAQTIEHAQPGSPVGFLLEAEARWWKTYCASCEIKWGMLDAWKSPKRPEDDAYFALADKAIDLAHDQMAKSDTAEPHVYVAIGFALKARLYSLRDEKRAIAHAGVAARSECLRALELDPDAADATAILGLYNYYVDTLSSIAKILRFFMGIPGGSKEEGIRQMRTAMDRAVFLGVDTRFYLAKNLRTYDQRYEEAIQVAGPLASRYPQNPVFLLLLGNLNQEAGHSPKAAEYLRSAETAPAPDSACAARARELANLLLSSLPF
jgi:tetratricopeptide (TPR) repeat protein